MAGQYEGSGRLEGNLRALKIAVVAMGVLIVLATAVLVATVIHRATAPRETAALPAAPAGNPGTVLLDEPAGTHIGSVVPVRDGLALLLQGGGPDRVVLVDPATGRPSERISLVR
jgi:hypothetical protein